MIYLCGISTRFHHLPHLQQQVHSCNRPLYMCVCVCLDMCRVHIVRIPICAIYTQSAYDSPIHNKIAYLLAHICNGPIVIIIMWWIIMLDIFRVCSKYTAMHAAMYFAEYKYDAATLAGGVTHTHTQSMSMRLYLNDTPLAMNNTYKCNRHYHYAMFCIRFMNLSLNRFWLHRHGVARCRTVSHRAARQHLGQYTLSQHYSVACSRFSLTPFSVQTQFY